MSEEIIKTITVNLATSSPNISESIQNIFENTNLHSSRTAQLVNNFEKLEHWAEKTYIELNEFSTEDLDKEIQKSLILSFVENQNTLYEIMKNKNIFNTIESQEKALEILSHLDTFDTYQEEELNLLIKEQISNKISNNLDKLNYQWYKILTNQELKIQRYDELKQHKLFSSLF